MDEKSTLILTFQDKKSYKKDTIFFTMNLKKTNFSDIKEANFSTITDKIIRCSPEKAA
jgi:hypothetical protein